MEEIWKNIKGYEGLYQVSNLGRVKSLDYRHTGKEKVLTVGIKDGYFIVNLWKNRRGKTTKVHRLVAEAFLPNPENKPHIDHVNTDRTDNRVENLRWCTIQENNNNPITRQKSGKPVIGVNKLTGEEVWFACSYEAQRVLGIGHSEITACCRGKRKSTGGYVWRYA